MICHISYHRFIVQLLVLVIGNRWIKSRVPKSRKYDYQLSSTAMHNTHPVTCKYDNFLFGGHKIHDQFPKQGKFCIVGWGEWRMYPSIVLGWTDGSHSWKPTKTHATRSIYILSACMIHEEEKEEVWVDCTNVTRPREWCGCTFFFITRQQTSANIFYLV